MPPPWMKYSAATGVLALVGWQINSEMFGAPAGPGTDRSDTVKAPSRLSSSLVKSVIEDCASRSIGSMSALNVAGMRSRMRSSAGGGLAAATVLLARDRSGPAILAQVLWCPMLDDRNNSYSARQMVGLGVWDASYNGVGWTALLGDAQGGPDVSPYAAPGRATDLSGLPPTFIDVGSAETFRDEAVAYASRIWQAGGSAELHVWPGGFHGFELLAPQAAISQTAKAAVEPWLRRTIGI